MEDLNEWHHLGASVSLWSDGGHNGSYLMIRLSWLGSPGELSPVPTESLSFIISLKLVTPCGPHQRAPRTEHMVPPPLPGLSQNSMADFAFWLEIYNDILACLYTSQEIFVEPGDSSVSTGRWAVEGDKMPPPCFFHGKAKAPVTRVTSSLQTRAV